MTFGADCGRQTVMIIQEVADMKIAVCIKQVPDTDDVKIDRKTGTLKRSEVSGGYERRQDGGGPSKRDGKEGRKIIPYGNNNGTSGRVGGS